MPDVNLSPYSADIARIEQQRRLAEALQAQSMQPIAESSVGGIPVKISPFQGLAKMLQASNARSAQMESDKLMRDLYGRAQADKSADLATFAKALQGTPGTPEQWTGEGIDERYTPAVQGMPAGRINPDVLSQLRDPMMQQMAMSLIAKQSEPFNLREGETRFGANNQPIASNPRPDSVHWVNGGTQQVPVSARTGAPVNVPSVQVQDRDANTWSDPYELGGAQVQKNIRTGEIRQAVSKPPINNVTTQVSNSGPKAFETALGQADAKQLGEWRDAALSADSSLGIVRNLRSAEQRGVYSGGGAQVKTAVANLINGITGAEMKSLPGSQLFNAEASKLVLDKIKTLGANPSNADRDFIEKTVPNLTHSKEARDALINFIEQRANEAIDTFQRADRHARANHGLSGFNAFRNAGRTESVLEQADRILNGGNNGKR